MEESRLSATEVRVHILVPANFVVLDVASQRWSGIMGEQYCLGVFACVQCLDYTSPLVFFPARNDRNVTILNESAQIVIAVEEGIPRQTIGTKPVTHQQVVVKHIRQDVRGSSQEPLHRDGVFRVTLYMFEQSG